jgi:hypothetical protein
MALTHRVERIQEQVREEVSQMLATEVRDPGVGLVTVTRTKVTGDLSLARIYWTILGDAAERKKTAQALERGGQEHLPRDEALDLEVQHRADVRELVDDRREVRGLVERPDARLCADRSERHQLELLEAPCPLFPEHFLQRIVGGDRNRIEKLCQLIH